MQLTLKCNGKLLNPAPDFLRPDRSKSQLQSFPCRAAETITAQRNHLHISFRSGGGSRFCSSVFCGLPSL
jgi:hypothetical protein